MLRVPHPYRENIPSIRHRVCHADTDSLVRQCRVGQFVTPILLRAGRRWPSRAMSTVVLHARSPSSSSFASSAPDDDFDFARLDDAADAARSHVVPTMHSGAVDLADPSSARAARSSAEAAMTVASLQEELRETKRRLEAYRSARMASRLAQTSKKTASALMEENPALAIPARLKEEARDAATALDRERSRTLELEREVARAREDARVAVEAAEAKAAEAVRAASLAAEKKIEDARLVARAAREAETDALTNGRNVRAALVDARTALELEQHRSHGLERESRVLHDTVLAARSVAEEARGKALAEAAAARVAAREKLFAVLRAMGDTKDDGKTDVLGARSTPSPPRDFAAVGGTPAAFTTRDKKDASTLGSPRVDPYAYAARLRSMRESTAQV